MILHAVPLTVSSKAAVLRSFPTSNKLNVMSSAHLRDDLTAQCS